MLYPTSDLHPNQQDFNNDFLPKIEAFFFVFVFQPVPEVTVVNNLPAIMVEEVIPTTVNDGTLLAPEEVHVSRQTKFDFM